MKTHLEDYKEDERGKGQSRLTEGESLSRLEKKRERDRIRKRERRQQMTDEEREKERLYQREYYYNRRERLYYNRNARVNKPPPRMTHTPVVHSIAANECLDCGAFNAVPAGAKRPKTCAYCGSDMRVDHD